MEDCKLQQRFVGNCLAQWSIIQFNGQYNQMYDSTVPRLAVQNRVIRERLNTFLKATGRIERL